MYSRYIKILLSTSILGDKEQNSFTGNDKTAVKKTAKILSLYHNYIFEHQISPIQSSSQTIRSLMISRHYYFEAQNIAFAAHTKDCIISPQSLHSILTQKQLRSHSTHLFLHYNLWKITQHKQCTIILQSNTIIFL